MKRVPLTRGMEALVDDDDYDYLMQCKWYCNKRGYAAHDSVGGRVLMHRLIGARMGLTPAFEVDHRDQNKLNNQQHNLRSATSGQNKANARLRCDSTTGYKGVHRDRRSGRCIAYISHDKRRYHLGTFLTPEDAARAYNAAAIEHFGEFAYLNPV